MHPGRQVLQEKGQTAMNGRGFNDMVVVQHKSEVSSIMDHEVVGEQGNDGLRQRWLRHLEQGERGGFAKARWCRNKGQWTLYSFLEPFNQLRARDELRTGTWGVQLGREQRVERITVRTL